MTEEAGPQGPALDCAVWLLNADCFCLVISSSTQGGQRLYVSGIPAQALSTAQGRLGHQNLL